MAGLDDQPFVFIFVEKIKYAIVNHSTFNKTV